MGAAIRTIAAAAPVRVCDNGGWTDTWFAQHGSVFNIAVRPLVEVRIDVLECGAGEAPVILDVVNYRDRYAPSLDGGAWGPHPLLEAALQTIPPPPGCDLVITIQSDAPPGASIGTSAAVVVALLAALNHLEGGGRTREDLAYEAHAVEAVRLGRQSGIQDQLCSALGGVNFMQVRYPRAVVSRLRLPDAVASELERRLSLIYLGRAHVSSTVHETVIQDVQSAGPEAPALARLRATAEQARDAFVAEDFSALGRAMSDNTEAQAALHPHLVQRDARRVIEIARTHGAVGWKVNGAGGGGGSITLMSGVSDSEKRMMIRTIEGEGFVPIPIALSAEGVQVWDIADHALPTCAKASAGGPKHPA